MGNIPSTSQSQASKTDFTTNIQLLRKIEDPHYGEIRLVRDLKTGEQIYLKEITFDSKAAYQAELIFFNKRLAVSHPNIVRILGCTGSDKQTFCSGYYKISVFIELLSKTLAEEIGVRLQTGIPFSENDILVVAENLIAGLSYFETQNIFHGDIRPENIFAATHSYKLSDPYLSLQKNANALSHAILGNAKTLLAPQLLIQVPRQNFSIDCNKFKADVFSLGMVLLSMASLTSSDELYDYDRGLLDLYELRRRLEVVRKSYSKFTYDMIRSMLKVNEEERPDFIYLSNRLLPYQEDIRRKTEMQFFGVRAPSEEVDDKAEDFFRAAFVVLQQQVQAEYELEDQLQGTKQNQTTERNMQRQENTGKQDSSRTMSHSNFEDIQNRADMEESFKNSSYIASINTTRLDKQPQAKKRPQEEIFGSTTKPGPTSDENVDLGMPSQKKQKETQSFVQNQNQMQLNMQRQQQEMQRQQEQQRQLQHQEEQQRQMHIQQKQQQMQLQRERQQGQLLQQQQFEQEQQRQRQFQLQQEQLAQKQNQAQTQMKVPEQHQHQHQQQHYQNNQNNLDSRIPSNSQKSALATRQANVEPQSNTKTRSPFGKRGRASVDIQVSGLSQPQPQPQLLQNQRFISNQSNYSQQKGPQSRVEGMALQQTNQGEFDDLEAKIQAALQRSNTTYEMAFNNLDQNPQPISEPSSSNVGMNAPNAKNYYDASSGQFYSQQKSEFVTYDANNGEEYGYEYTTEGNAGYVIRKHGHTVVLNDF